MVVGAAVSYISQWRAQRSVDKATEKLEERLPEPITRITDVLPADVVRLGGAAVAAGQAAKTAAGATSAALSAGRSATRTARKVGDAASDTSQRVRNNGRAFADRVTATGDSVRHETQQERRRLTSDYLRHTDGDDAALDALLDIRSSDADELPVTPDPVREGRRRFRPSLPVAPVNRVQRTYRPPTRRWDR